jgi:hypothetical protein
VTGSPAALVPMSAPPLPPAGPIVRLFPCPDWSKISVIVQYVPAQNESCAAALAYPPALSVPMFVVAPSELRLTW